MCKVTIAVIKEICVTSQWRHVGDVAQFGRDCECILSSIHLMKMIQSCYNRDWSPTCSMTQGCLGSAAHKSITGITFEHFLFSSFSFIQQFVSNVSIANWMYRLRDTNGWVHNLITSVTLDRSAINTLRLEQSGRYFMIWNISWLKIVEFWFTFKSIAGIHRIPLQIIRAVELPRKDTAGILQILMNNPHSLK